MSATDKTKPWAVRAIEHGARAVHRHETGPCDLPALTPLTFGWPGNRRRCYWTERFSFYYARNGRCACPACSGRFERRVERRKDRHNAKRLARLERVA